MEKNEGKKERERLEKNSDIWMKWREAIFFCLLDDMYEIHSMFIILRQFYLSQHRQYTFASSQD